MAGVNDEIIKGLRGELTKRELKMMGFSAETKRRIVALIEVSPVLEEAILDLADCAYSDGVDSAC